MAGARSHPVSHVRLHVLRGHLQFRPGGHRTDDHASGRGPGGAGLQVRAELPARRAGLGRRAPVRPVRPVGVPAQAAAPGRQPLAGRPAGPAAANGARAAALDDARRRQPVFAGAAGHVNPAPRAERRQRRTAAAGTDPLAAATSSTELRCGLGGRVPAAGLQHLRARGAAARRARRWVALFCRDPAPLSSVRSGLRGGLAGSRARPCLGWQRLRTGDAGGGPQRAPVRRDGVECGRGGGQILLGPGAAAATGVLAAGRPPRHHLRRAAYRDDRSPRGLAGRAGRRRPVAGGRGCPVADARATGVARGPWRGAAVARARAIRTLSPADRGALGWGDRGLALWRAGHPAALFPAHGAGGDRAGRLLSGERNGARRPAGRRHRARALGADRGVGARPPAGPVHRRPASRPEPGARAVSGRQRHPIRLRRLLGCLQHRVLRGRTGHRHLHDGRVHHGVRVAGHAAPRRGGLDLP